MILSCNNICKAFIVNELLKDVSFIINEKEKVALIGINGAGKTTLFRIITGELLPDDGEVLVASGKTIGYLKQNALSETTMSLYDEVYHANEAIIHIQSELKSLEEKIHMHEGDKKHLDKLNIDYDKLRQLFESMDGYQYNSLVGGVLNGLGFTAEDYTKSVATLSGGQKTRVALAKELIKKPDILMLDEPTNHLDIDAITWLENYLQSYNGTILIISHDRFFLDQVTNKTIEIEGGQAQVYQGSYTDFMTKKEHSREVQIKHYEQQQKSIKQQEEVIKKLKSFNREKSVKRAESREKMLGKVTRLERPMDVHADMHLNLKPRFESGFDVLKVIDISKSFGHLHLFDHLNFEIKKGEHVAFIGDNGTGKSTLFKIINKVIKADSGKIQTGAKVKIGYYDQEHQLLNASNTLIEEISDAYPTLTQGEIRNILASYLFKADDVYKTVGNLSGGEKGRLTLVKLMLSEANFLVLDEPTNHLDLISKNILEDALTGYQGTLFVISHDRYFVNRIATKILHLEDKKINTYLGDYDYFAARRKLNQQEENKIDANVTETKMSWIEEKAYKAEKRKLETRFEALEAEIHELEILIKNLEAQLLEESVYTNHVKASEITNKKESNELSLESLYEEWESVTEALEAYTS